MLEEEPVITLIMLQPALFKGDLVFRLILLWKVLKNATPFKQANWLAILKIVLEGGNSSIWVDFKKPWFFLPLRRYVDVLCLVGDPELF